MIIGWKGIARKMKKIKTLFVLLCVIALIGCIENQKSIEIDGSRQIYKYTSTVDEGESSIEDLVIDFEKGQDGSVILRARVGQSRSIQEDDAIQELRKMVEENPELFEGLAENVFSLIKIILGLP